MRKKSYYRTCPTCGDNLDPGEICETCVKRRAYGKSRIYPKKNEPGWIHAIQWTGENLLEIRKFMGDWSKDTVLNYAPPRLIIKTGETESAVELGDYIYREGHQFPVVYGVMTDANLQQNFTKFFGGEIKDNV